MTWALRAACRDNPRPLWDDALDHEPRWAAAGRHAQAVIICRTCPVLAKCAAARGEHDSGVWAGVLYRRRGEYGPVTPRAIPAVTAERGRLRAVGVNSQSAALLAQIGKEAG